MEAKLFHVVAIAKNRVIGKDGKLPWHFSSDLKHFKELTWGSTVVMGRKTFESLGKPLPGRQNFVLTHAKGDSPLWGDRQMGLGGPGPVRFFRSLEEALGAVETPHCYIIGGAEIFKQTISGVDGIYLTCIDQEYKGDASYPEIPDCFKEMKREMLQENPKLEVIYYEK
ncbi:MAG: dihydrofolate reductase [Candidatus Omnitrophica bacterium]|nr:dihydrofolate reductase [Candidatus Omnitrophota bacterium]